MIFFFPLDLSLGFCLVRKIIKVKVVFNSSGFKAKGWDLGMNSGLGSGIAKI